jgi:hypothetical protein
MLSQMSHLHEVGTAVCLLDGERAAGEERTLERLRVIELTLPAAQSPLTQARASAGQRTCFLHDTGQCIVQERRRRKQRNCRRDPDMT